MEDVLVQALLKRFADNSDIDDLGIIKFLRAFCAKAFKNFCYGIPQAHKEILYEVLLDKPNWKVYDRQIVIAAPRGFSKTTLLSKGLALYCACLGIKKYIVLASKTARASQRNLRWIRNMLGSSALISVFGDLRTEPSVRKLMVDQIEGKYTSEIVVLKNGVTIEAIGMGQQLRGASEGEESSRVDLFIADDCETDENTATANAREENEVWLFETVFPALDIERGTLVFINTLTHNSSILAKLLKSKGWRKKFYQITTIDEHGVERSVWEEKFPLHVVKRIHEWYKSNGRERSFYKEYYNIIRTERGFNEKWINRYQSAEVFIQNGYTWIRITFQDGSQHVYPATLSLGIDSSFSLSEHADWSVLLPLARIPNGRRIILPYVRGRFTAFDQYKVDGVEEVLEHRGIISEALRLYERYRFSIIVIDVTAQQRTLLELLRREFEANYPDTLPQILGFNAGKERTAKLDRLVNYLQPKYEAGLMYHPAIATELDRELISIGDATDDILDALYNADIYSYDPSDIKYSPVLLPKSHVDAMRARSITRRLDWVTM
ncbi:MAG: hypothetical protein QXQ02_06710 [Halobacteria archaeon]